MVGGRIGKDGIHGATFSSEALSETSPTSAVQIGDPITQKKMLDMLLEARDPGLYDGITDNGAGGLSSSLGEMAGISGGIRIDLDRCPLKYQGLAPWEILVSESQERMSLAVPPGKVDAFLALAQRRDVEAAVVGEFTDTGRVEVFAAGALVGLLRLDFLHDGLPVMDLRARWEPPAPALGRAGAGSSRALPPVDLRAAMAGLLADPNVASKEEWVRQYDHEVQGRSVVKPFVGAGRDAPSDGAVLRVRPESRRGITVTHGICPWYGDEDAYSMAQCAVDEAVRAHVALGGDPDRMSALDNFCWPDPVEGPDNPDGAFKLAPARARLPGACRRLRRVQPSSHLGQGLHEERRPGRAGSRSRSVPRCWCPSWASFPTCGAAVTTDFKGARRPAVPGRRDAGRAGRHARRAAHRPGARARPRRARPTEALRSYRRLHRAMRRGMVRSCHDLSDGGLWVALAESALGGRLGAAVSLDAVPLGEGAGREPARVLFCETPSRLLVSVPAAHRARWLRAMAGVACAKIGEVTADPVIRVSAGGRELAAMSVEEARRAWSGEGRESA